MPVISSLLAPLQRETIPSTGVYATDDDPRNRGTLPTADDDGPDPREVCSSGEGCWVRFKRSQWLVSILSIDDASESIDTIWSFITVEHFDDACKGRRPSSCNSSFPTSDSKFCFSSSVVPSPSNTCGNGECSLDFAESVLGRKDSALLVLALDSGTGGVGVTPDAGLLAENRYDMVDTSLVVENLEYR